MVIRQGEMRTEQRDRMRGGEGTISITHLVPPGELPHGRLLAALEIPVGGSIGLHEHGAETEYYLISSGTGEVVDGGARTEVSAGDVVVTGGGASHSISNASGETLKLIALIITH